MTKPCNCDTPRGYIHAMTCPRYPRHAPNWPKPKAQK